MNSEYKTNEGFKKYEVLTKTIKVKDAADTTFQVKISQHGPIMNGLIKHIDEDQPIAMNWIYTKLKNETKEKCEKSSMSRGASVLRIHRSSL